MDMHDVLGLILGGGRGTRLSPLTHERSKPAVPLAGKYRLIDVPISNCLHAGIDKIAILTQFNSVSLHRHINNTYRRDMFTEGWVEVLAAEQTPQSNSWYQGTADAVRRQLVEISSAGTKYVLILAGDHLYQMDYRKFIQFHVENHADISIAVQPVETKHAPSFGILKRNSEGRIVTYSEKPSLEELPNFISMPDSEKPYMASMGIYVFSTELLLDLLNSGGDDFGKDIVPKAIPDYRVMGYVYDGYWADIGTIRRFYEVNLELTAPNSLFDFNNPSRPIYTHARFLPPCEVYGAKMERVLLIDGSRVYDATIKNSVIGLRSIVGSRVSIESTVMMGADYYEVEDDRVKNRERNRPDIGIGEGSVIEAALIDKNARIGKNVHIRNMPGRPDSEASNWFARDGLVIIPKNAILPDGMVI